MTALAIAAAFWAHTGRELPACLTVHLRALAPGVLGYSPGYGRCDVFVARRLLPARSRAAGDRLCLTVIHETGHALGRRHRARGVMAPRYRRGAVPAACAHLKLPARCVTCR